MLDKGVIDFGSHYFQTETPNTYQQSALRSPEVKKTQDSYEISGDYIISPESKYKFSEKIQKIKNGISYQASVTSDTKIKDDFAFVFYMPTKLYLGRVWIDDKQFDLKSGEKFLAKKIRVVRDFTVLEIRGEFECQVVRVKRGTPRNWGVSDNIKISVKYLRESDTMCGLKIDLLNLPNFVSHADLGKKAQTPLALPVPDGKNIFVSVDYNIAKGVKGLVVADGQNANIGGTKKKAGYLSILNGFEAVPQDKNVLGKVVVTFAKGAPESFDITKDNSGAINSENAPKNATVAWRSEWEGKPVALYSTEIPLDNRIVKSVRLVNESGSNWKIAAATYYNNKLGAIENEENFVTPSDIYQPIVYKRPAKKGSILDMSWILDAPAGKYGRVKSADGAFTFEKAPEKRVRFYGANNCFTANAPSKEDAVKIAEQYAALGFNIVRIHHYDQLCSTSANGNSAELNEEVMDRFDFLFNEFKKRGIYMTIDFYTTRRLLKKEYSDIKYDGDNMKLVFAASDMGVENLRQFIRNMLNHVNKYTGLA